MDLHVEVILLNNCQMLVIFPFSRLRQKSHGGCDRCDRSAEDADSSMAPDPTSYSEEVPVCSAPVLYFSFGFCIFLNVFQ